MGVSVSQRLEPVLPVSPPPLEALLRQLRSLVRERLEPLHEEARLQVARSVAAVSLESYWQRLPPCPLQLAPLTSTHSAIADFAASAAETLPRPLAAYVLTSLYTLALPEPMRSADGVFYTPPALAERLLDMVEGAGFDWRTGTVVDPSCGGGAFLCAAARRMARALEQEGRTPGEVLESISQRLSGVELDPFAGWMAQVLLEVELWPYCLSARTRLPALVRQADALEGFIQEEGRYDLVVGNPPYGRVTLSTQQRERFARSLYGHANLYGLFTNLAVGLCRGQGLIAYVTPASFLGGQYFHKLRQLLRDEAPPLAIDFITDRSGVFDEVLQETVLALFQRARERSAQVGVHFTQAPALDRPCAISRVGRFSLPEDHTAPWLLPREQGQVALLRQATKSRWRLSDYGVEVSTGPLVWNRHKSQLAMEPGPGCHPLIWAEAVLPGGTFRYSATRRNHQPYLRLEPNQSHLLVTQGAVLVQRTTAKEQSRRLIAALMPEQFVAEHGGVVVENHLNVIRPRDTMGVPLRAIAVLLNSAAVDQLFRCISGSVAVSAYELESLPVIPWEALGRLEELVARGASLGECEEFIWEAYEASS
jgi:adenine-specific DNA-methyltransferase